MRSPASWHGAAAVALGLFLLVVALGLPEYLNRAFYDGVLRAEADPARLAPNAVLVLIDEASLEKLSSREGQRWPWSRDTFAALFVALHQAGAREVVTDLTFLEPSEDALQDSLLASYAAACGTVILAETEDKPQILWPPEFQQKYPALHLATRVGKVRHAPDADGVLRRYEFTDSLAARAAAAAPSGMQWLRWPTDLATLERRFPERVMSAYSWILSGRDIMKVAQTKLGDGEFDPERLAALLPQLPVPAGAKTVRGKVVFVGANAAGTYDTKATPLSKNDPGVMYHVTAWSNAEQHDWIEAGTLPGASLLAALILGGVVFAVGVRGNGIRPVLVAGWGLLFLVTLGSAALLRGGFYFPPAGVDAAVLVSFTVVVVRNWRLESERKREIQNLFGSYVSSRVLEDLLKNPETVRLGGERRELTVYFSDLAGFTDMSEGLEPEALVEVMNRYLSEMSPFIINNGGYLDKYIGDAIMGVFGAPEPLVAHAAAAATAALQSRDHLRELSDRLEQERGLRLVARYGINTGDMIVGNLGSDRKINYTVVGDAVNLASRLEGANKEFGTTILLGEKTAALLDARFAARPVELLRVKGKKKPVQTFELVDWTERLPAAEQAWLEEFRLGYAAYRQREFAAAERRFQIALTAAPEDKLARIYAERSALYVIEPPPADWDGVFVMTKK